MCTKNYFSLELFGMLDWVNNWQSHFSETGPTGLFVPEHYSSLLRSEAGARFYERLERSWGQVLFIEKLSYVNQTPFQLGDTSVSFAVSDLFFPVSMGSTQSQNLGAIEFHCLIVPERPNSFYGSIDLQGEFGSSFQSYFAAATIGRTF